MGWSTDSYGHQAQLYSQRSQVERFLHQDCEVRCQRIPAARRLEDRTRDSVYLRERPGGPVSHNKQRAQTSRAGLASNTQHFLTSDNARHQSVRHQVQPLRQCAADNLGGDHLQPVPLLERQGPQPLLLLPPGHPQDHRDRPRPHRSDNRPGGGQGKKEEVGFCQTVHSVQGYQLSFGSTDADFIGIGASIFLTITLLMFTVSYLIGHLPPTLLEVITTLTGAVLMIAAGALAISHHKQVYQHPEVRYRDEGHCSTLSLGSPCSRRDRHHRGGRPGGGLPPLSQNTEDFYWINYLPPSHC